MEDITYVKINEHERDHWWYRVRRKLVKQLINRWTPVVRPRILDVGCGTGMLLTELSDIADVVGIDISPLAIDFCKTRGLHNVALSDGNTIPFPDSSFDMILALDVIEHIKDDTAAVSEIRRVLKPSGVAIIFVPAFMFLWGKNDELGRHYRRYTLSQLVTLFEKSGYAVKRASYFNFFLFLPILLVRSFVRLLGIKTGPELDANSRFVNEVLYYVFNLETLLLRVLNLPFGVSALVVAQK